MTSAATARARARRQLRTGDAIPEIRRSEPATREESRAHLRVLPEPAPVSHRRTLSKLSLVVLGLSGFIIAVIVFQATIAEQQLRLDRVSNDLRMAETHYDNLRQQRAELLAPTRLREEAMMLGMYQGLTAKFVAVPASVVAEVLASTANMDPLFAEPPAGIAAERAMKTQTSSSQSSNNTSVASAQAPEIAPGAAPIAMPTASPMAIEIMRP